MPGCHVSIETCHGGWRAGGLRSCHVCATTADRFGLFAARGLWNFTCTSLPLVTSRQGHRSELGDVTPSALVAPRAFVRSVSSLPSVCRVTLGAVKWFVGGLCLSIWKRVEGSHQPTTVWRSCTREGADWLHPAKGSQGIHLDHVYSLTVPTVEAKDLGCLPTTCASSLRCAVQSPTDQPRVQPPRGL